MCAPLFTWRRAISWPLPTSPAATDFERARADHVGAFAHDQGPRAVLRLDQFDAGVDRAMARLDRAGAASFPPSARWRECVVGGSAAAADDIEPAVARRSGRAAPESVVGVSRYSPLRSAAPRSDSRNERVRAISDSVRTWSVMNSGPVAQFSPIDSSRMCRSRPTTPPRSARRASCPSARSCPRSSPEWAWPSSRARAESIASTPALMLRVSWQVSTRKHIRAAILQALAWFVKICDKLLEGDAAGDADGLRRRPMDPATKRGFSGVENSSAGLRAKRRRAAHLVSFVLHLILGQNKAVLPKLFVSIMSEPASRYARWMPQHHIGPRQLTRYSLHPSRAGPPKVRRECQDCALLQHGAHRAIQNEDAALTVFPAARCLGCNWMIRSAARTRLRSGIRLRLAAG
jgi:hypothetical protein